VLDGASIKNTGLMPFLSQSMAANHVNVSGSIMMFLLSHTSHHNACRPCTGAHRRDFLLGIRCGQPAGAHVRFRCSRHRRSLAAPSKLARPVDLSYVPPRPLASGTARPLCRTND
jgi:hypothetical protein